MNIRNKGFKAQSAMEYLMTYGWAILIIAVVLAVLFSLNVFNAGAQLGTACIGSPGYSCSAPYLNSAGQLQLTLGLGTGATAYNVLFSCVSSANSLTASSLPYNAITATGGTYAGAAAAVGATTNTIALGSIASGAQPTFTGIQCWGTSGGSAIASGSPIGTSFTGSIWMAYQPASGGAQLSSTYQYVKIATLSIKTTS